MGFDFGNYATLSVTDKTAEYEIVEMQGDPKPVLILRPAGTENKPFFNALLKEFGGNQRAFRSQRLSGDALDKSRAATVRLFPAYVVADWRNVKDITGADVPFSVEACENLFGILAATAPYVLDGIRAFCDDPQNFLVMAPINVEAVAGN